MRITLNTGRNEERYQILCRLAVDEYSRGRQNWSDMTDIDDSDGREIESLPILMMPIMRNESSHLPFVQAGYGDAIGDTRRLLRADF